MEKEKTALRWAINPKNEVWKGYMAQKREKGNSGIIIGMTKNLS